MTYLGIDCGTQSLKVIAWEPDSGRISSASRAYPLISGLPPGHKEQSPELWIEGLDECMERLRRDVDFSRVRGIGISGQQHGLVVLDEGHSVIRPVKLWNDTSTQLQCRQILEAAGGPENYREEIGNSLPPGFTASKILWLRENEPGSYDRVRWILLPHDFLNFHLTGEMVTEAGDASGTGYFKVRERQWSPAALSWIDSHRDLSACLPRLIGSQEPAGQLRKEIGERWGIPSGVTVSSGGGDNMMGAIGSGNVSPGTVTLSLGTSGTLYSYSRQPVIDPAGEVAAFCDSTGAWLPLGCTMNVTVATETIRGSLLPGTIEDFDLSIERVPAGSSGLILLPYLEGERMPNVPDGTGVLFGFRPSTADARHIARASMEGATFGLHYGLERLQELGVEPREIRLIGGGARSRVWRNIVAQIFDTPVVCPRNQEGPAFGAALQAMWCGEGGDIREITGRYVLLEESWRGTPNPQETALYRELYHIYRSFSQALIDSNVFSAHRKFIQERG
ncbi:MAG: xylulokinase [Acidobacteriota bacterium]